MFTYLPFERFSPLFSDVLWKDASGHALYHCSYCHEINNFGTLQHNFVKWRRFFGNFFTSSRLVLHTTSQVMSVKASFFQSKNINSLFINAISQKGVNSYRVIFALDIHRQQLFGGLQLDRHFRAGFSGGSSGSVSVEPLDFERGAMELLNFSILVQWNKSILSLPLLQPLDLNSLHRSWLAH